MIWDILMCILVLSWFSVHIYLSIKTFKKQIAEIDRIYDELEKAVEKIKAGE